MSSVKIAFTALAGAFSVAVAAFFLTQGVSLDGSKPSAAGSQLSSCSNSSIELENVNGTLYLYQDQGSSSIGSVKLNVFRIGEGTSSRTVEIETVGERYSVANASDVMDVTAESSRCPGKTAIINP